MLICMKPSDKQLDSVRGMIAEAYGKKGLSHAEISRIARVHPSQVSRICGGRFKTFSHNVMQICKALDVSVPSLEIGMGEIDPAWERAQSSMSRMWNETPEGAVAISRVLDAIAELQIVGRHPRTALPDRPK